MCWPFFLDEFEDGDLDIAFWIVARDRAGKENARELQFLLGIPIDGHSCISFHCGKTFSPLEMSSYTSSLLLIFLRGAEDGLHLGRW